MTTATGEGAGIDGAVSLLQAFADPTRMRLLGLLSDEHELTVAELTRITELGQSRVSTHLRRLKDSGLVRDRHAGASTFYSLNAQAMPARARALWDLVRGSLGDRLFDADRRRRDELLSARAGAWAHASESDRHYTPGRTWEATARGLMGLVELGEVLDIGSGDGATAELFVRRARHVTLLDRSESALRGARRRLSGYPNTAFVVGDLLKLPFEPERFDQVLLLNVLSYTAEPHVALAEAARVLRPGGRLTVVTLAAHEHAELARSYGHANHGFSPAALRDLARAARLEVELSEITAREPRAPHLEILTLFAQKPREPRPRALPGTRASP